LTSRTLVLGAAHGYEVPDVWIFVESLRRYYAGDVMLVVSSSSSPEFFRYLESRQIMPVYFDCAGWMVPHVQLTRFLRYSDLFHELDERYDRVLLSDVSDVFFQTNPFEGTPEGDLLCFLEASGHVIGQCPNHKVWIEHLYGKEMLARLANREVSCSGTTLGTFPAIREYVRKLIGEIRPHHFIALGRARGHDQGIHNVLLYTGALPNARIIPNGMHVYTVAVVPDEQIRLGQSTILVSESSVCCPIVHQYNYKPNMLHHISAQYPLPLEYLKPHPART